MALPLLALTFLGIKGGLDIVQGFRTSQEAEELIELVDDLIDDAHQKINDAKNSTKTVIEQLGREKIEASANELKEFVKNYRKLKNVKISYNGISENINDVPVVSDIILSEMDDISLKATDLAGSGLAGLGAGALLGWGTYGGVMALGTASTGTAIASLSGAAATNATLAWLGGGSIAAGGGGVALGTAVLGGLVAGPALLIAGGLFKSKAEEKANNACAYFAEAEKAVSEIQIGIEKLNHISETALQIRNILSVVRQYCSVFNTGLKLITSVKTDWRTFTVEEKNVVAASVKMIQILKSILDSPLLTKDGELTIESRKIIEQQIN